ncbi:sigma-54-dependent Fis family transcriptional regulator [Peribacillus butanolivorans]|uniref:sigma-54-dependent Fis family transcriptional regulator n=1 Tax=Peribacillus butanolivorans TaxID=421767 RepID=UPI0036D7C27C
MSVNISAPKETIPTFIQESWKRCHSKGLQPRIMDKENMLGEFELAEFQDQYAELLYYSSPILEDVYSSIHGMESILLLAAPEGYIIETVGDPSFIRHADNVALRKGANWLEESKGTNAIGTAIVEKKTVLIHGSQHFYQDNHFLTCTATPIYHPDGHLLGVLNLSSHQQDYHPFSISLVQRVADSIKQALLLAQTQKREKNLYFIYDQHPDPLFTINKEGNVTSLNIAASRAIGSIEQTTTGQPISSIISGLDTLALIKGLEQKVTIKNQKFTAQPLIKDTQHLSYVTLRLEKLKQIDEQTNRYHFSDIISNDSQMNQTISIAKRAAKLDISLLITGESGTGKELFSQSIHGVSFRRDKPFIAINCSAIPENLLESELFGYEKGAFTGANSGGHKGKFEAANGGTLFLDEIGDMPLTAQATLLRVLQERCVTRVGGNTSRPIDVRIIAATNKDLQQEIEAGQFRADLFFRLNGLTLKLPKLKNRTDLLMLAEHVLSHLPYRNESTELTEDAKTFIFEYEWPGNFRELQNVLGQAAFLANQNPITKALLVSLCPVSSPSRNVEETKEQEPTSMLDQEIQLIKKALERTNGNISTAAKQLKIGRNTLYRKMRTYKIMR